MNRLATAQNQTGFSPSWGQSFAHDGFGNLTGTSVIKGSAPSMAATYEANNHAGGEDANGNPGYVPAPAQGSSLLGVYDVENRLVELFYSSNPYANYSYDPSNKRVWRGSWTYSGGTYTRATDEVTFWSVSGRKLGTYNITQSGSTLYCTQSALNYYFGGKLIKDKNGWVYPDRLGSIGKYYPYGIERPSATSNDTEKFTGYVRDAETGNDYAVNRYETPGYARFLTADPSLSGNALTLPDNWNRYAYVGDDPINKTDPLGLCSPDDDPPCYSTTGTGYTDPNPGPVSSGGGGGSPPPASSSACDNARGEAAVNCRAQIYHIQQRQLFSAAALSIAQTLQAAVSNGAETDCQAMASFANQLLALPYWNTGESISTQYVDAFSVFVPLIGTTSAVGLPSSGNAIALNLGQPGETSGYAPMYQNDSGQNPTGDQGHHFAAFFEYGFFHPSTYMLAAFALEVGEAGYHQTWVNWGDIRLGFAAGAIGAGVANGSISLSQVPGLIQNLCGK